MTPEKIVDLIETARVDLSTETLAQRGLARIFADAGIEAKAEVRLNQQDRIDFMIGRIGLEVKIGHPRRAILRQLERYAKSDEVDTLILVTSAAFPTTNPPIDGKDLHVASLSRGWL